MTTKIEKELQGKIKVLNSYCCIFMIMVLILATAIIIFGIQRNNLQQENEMLKSQQRNSEVYFRLGCEKIKEYIFSLQYFCPFPNERNVSLSKDCVALNWYYGLYENCEVLD